ncbi:MAG TPA: alternative ribosome rescue aminoacyl-tRNA hydrolase ArfB [Flavobacteriaceae bacterium]|nr:aminoacyl-tRNA hydrolase [Flavobacteriaceae bacterium]MCB9212623.1 aminoacyl-tRNA hydrolase [Alteromonas sp.]HPF11516.1 alternative ribosome rescue aminoacyl-tRNA hydrolase ArfB [Flavobacteriaceae bacterium]HQU21049.1 alternative ribosome rescue aminoacyl-tRNA hydrolase ArfB [Flavobacteriaceae bacterium]HQU65950.1 alternative ribosome rescue aminoacyl-tRNA hydrolase ArfB [Flavobacteriaceae bacterium]
MKLDKILQELEFKALRSSGPGGQHVNKTASKIELSFNVLQSEGLTEAEKQRLQEKLGSRLTADGILLMQCGETRSQHRNKKLVIERLLQLLQENLRIPKPRKKSKLPKAVIEKRLEAKRRQGLKKAQRRPPQTD